MGPVEHYGLRESAPELLTPKNPPQNSAPIAAIASLRILWEHRRAIVRTLLGGAGLGLLLAFLLPAKYQATAQLMPPDSQSASSMALLAGLSARSASPLGAVAGDLLGLQSSGDLFIGLLRSRTLEDRMVERFDLQRVYGKRLEQDARQKLEENSSITQDRKSGILAITVTDHEPQRAAAMAQAYIEELDRLVADVSTSAARRERIFLEQRLQAVKTDLDQASHDFSQFSAKNGAIDIKEQGRAMLDAAATLMGQLIAAESELKGLEAIYVPGNVRIRTVEARIQELRTELAKMGGENGFVIAGEDATGQSTYPSIRELPLLGATYADLYRRTRIQETVYETLTQQYELAKVQEAKETPSVKILDFAKVPERKSYPPRFEIVVMCTTLSAIASGLWFLGQAHWATVDEHHPGKVLAFEVYQNLSIAVQSLGSKAWGITKIAQSWRQSASVSRRDESAVASDAAKTSPFPIGHKADAS
jgi:capsule polysaccharide export protein KpsE/RkpR